MKPLLLTMLYGITAFRSHHFRRTRSRVSDDARNTSDHSDSRTTEAPTAEDEGL